MSLSMSADAFAVSISKGASVSSNADKKNTHTVINISEAIKIGLLFGLIEGFTPILGWLAGSAASAAIESIDHWICFAILAFVGGKMIYESFQSKPKKTKPSTQSFSKIGKLSLLILTAIGTSIDAMAVGVSLAFIEVNILVAAASIGMATTLMVFIGTMAGNFIGAKVGKLAEALGGVALILIGTHILLSHLSAQFW